MARREAWYEDPWLWGALVVGLLLRVLPIWLWTEGSCLRDECAYVDLSRAIARGEGLQANNGWLWAPGYPYMLALVAEIAEPHRFKRVQMLLSMVTVGLTYGLTRRAVSDRAARHAAWWTALHPTLAYFTGTLWTETMYGFAIVVAVTVALWARQGAGWRGLAVGVSVAGLAYLRGVGTWVLPLFALALLWPEGETWRAAVRARWRHALAAVLAAVILITPYAMHASIRHEGLILTDATVGQVAYIGNNDFPLFTYDWGSGLVSDQAVWRHLQRGRKRCDLSLPVGRRNACEVNNAIAWVRAHPGEFVARIPHRWAQLLNPNSFLTRHVRLGRWPGLPWWAKETLVVWVVLTSIAVFFGGALGAAARARGAVGVLTLGLVAYQLCVVAAFFGLTRFRVPLEPLLIVWLASLSAHPRQTWRLLTASRPRLAAWAISTALLVPLVAWYALSGIPALWR